MKTITAIAVLTLTALTWAKQSFKPVVHHKPVPGYMLISVAALAQR